MRRTLRTALLALSVVGLAAPALAQDAMTKHDSMKKEGSMKKGDSMKKHDSMSKDGTMAKHDSMSKDTMSK